MIIVVLSLKIHQKRRMAMKTESGGGQQCAFHTVGFLVLENQAGRITGSGVVVSQLLIEEFLDAFRRGKGAQNSRLLFFK